MKRTKAKTKAKAKTKPEPPSRWSCPNCERQFGRKNQSHGCMPAMTVDAYFADRSESDRAIYDAVAKHLATLGDIVTDALTVGIVFKRTRTFASLRPRREGFRLAFLFSRTLEDARIAKSMKVSANRIAYWVDLKTPRDADRVVKKWLSEAYVASALAMAR
jgi:hypothetical protein